MRNPVGWLAASLLFCAGAVANDDIFCSGFQDACAPLVVTGNTLALYTAHGPPVVAAPSLVIFDSADAALIGATVQLTLNFHPGEDVLAFTNSASISGTYNPVAGTLTLSGSASPDEYQAALRTVTYSDSAATPRTDVRTLQWWVTNASMNSLPAPTTATVSDCPTTSPPMPNVVVNAAYGPGYEETVQFMQNGATGCDLGTGCELQWPLDGTLENIFDASTSYNPGHCGVDDSALTYQWTLRFPPSIMGGGIATYSGVTGANTPVLHIAPSGLPALAGADIKYRVILRITNANNPSLFTDALFRFQYDSSECLLINGGDCPP